jgi:hypothetical protein
MRSNHGPGPDRGDRVDNWCDEFEDGWLAGERPVIEDVLRQAPADLMPDLLMELVRVDVDYRRRAGW